MKFSLGAFLWILNTYLHEIEISTVDVGAAAVPGLKELPVSIFELLFTQIELNFHVVTFAAFYELRNNSEKSIHMICSSPSGELFSLQFTILEFYSTNHMNHKHFHV